ncbi:ABC transporter ATP-binding protein [Streptomyces sp. V4I2]|uniref:ABC transporter ATP-binding protein n=1 Tax=Streptomyces sp. V4I2 TaxID=3042280 RepID=UPI002788BDFF|nr:ABC transporter ATP-binding protein [Streptomyces sp. V4I2]MDQ1051249.1 putative ABC transport system ATP-binding protein [Streptomyces sp. V4I2]
MVRSWGQQGDVFAAKGRYAVQLTDLTKQFGEGPTAVLALDRVSLGIEPGTFTAVMGPSGSGKSTFLHCAAGLDRPTSGEVRLGGQDLAALRERRLTELRRTRIGFVFQAFNLLPSLTVEQNITLPLRLAGKEVDAAWFHHIMTTVGLGDCLARFPAQLSGGQQQRVAIARALVTRPQVIFADEPTGALDPQTARDILGLLRQAVTDLHQTVIMVTHDPVAAAHTDHAVFLSTGRIVDEMGAPSADRVAEVLSGLRRTA